MCFIIIRALGNLGKHVKSIWHKNVLVLGKFKKMGKSERLLRTFSGGV